jgi:hypothetical protein
MKSLATSIKRAAAALSLAGLVSVAALGAGAAHAGPVPHIAVSTLHGASVLHVTGSGFGAGDPVKILAINDDTSAPETWVLTTASPNSPHLRGGAIHVNTPSVSVHCSYKYVTVRAIDWTTGAVSNGVQARLGLGPC